MKQHITWEQLKIINSEILVPLVKNGILSQKGHHLIKDKYMAKQLNIGKMIEILYSSKKAPIIQEDEVNCSWNVLCGYDEGEFEIDIDDECLVDALWQAVKEVL